MAATAPSSRDEFEVAIICALPKEYDAVSLVFDEFWDDDGDEYGRGRGDTNQYTTGRIGKHNVVLALLPSMGKINAASVAASMRSSYEALRLALLIGICGGAPFGGGAEILLGDVIISNSVVQYDFGRQYPDTFVRKDTVEGNLGRPNRNVRSLLASFNTERNMEILENRTKYFLLELQKRAGNNRRIGKHRYRYPGASRDTLFRPGYRHKHHSSPICICEMCVTDFDAVCEEALSQECSALGCHECQTSDILPRQRLEEKRQLEQEGNADLQNPMLHIGPIASGDTVLKSGAHRDRIAADEGVVAFEMEGAGVWDEIPCLVVKGVSDYADCHKNKEWQNFAAATAASAAKAILERYIQTSKKLNETAPEHLGIASVRFSGSNYGSQIGVNYGTVSSVFHQQNQINK